MGVDEVLAQSVAEVAHRFGFGTPERVDRLPGGNVNDTFYIEATGRPRVIQRLSPLFDAKVVADYAVISEHLRRQGLVAPELMPDPKGNSAVRYQNRWWRALEYVPHERIAHPTPAQAREAGYLLAQYHHALASLPYTPQHDMRWIHDTTAFLERTSVGIAQSSNGVTAQAEDRFKELREHLAYWRLPADLPDIVIHGDPKSDNVFFRDGKAIGLGDYDNVMRAPRLIDIGDALRSWSAAGTQFDRAVYDAAVAGYASGDGPMPEPEHLYRAAIHFTLELALRYLADIFQPEGDRFFTWDPARHGSHADHNLARCAERLEYARKMIAEFEQGRETPFIHT